MSEHPYYNQAVHGPYELYDLGDFALEEGGTLRGCQLAYATHGTLNAKKDNAILIPTWFSGTSKIFEAAYIGKGRALDPDNWFIIVVNQIGNGLSSSPSNTPPPFDRARFPRVRIGDDVRAQHEFITKKFGLTRLALVTGGSMGAQQIWEWAVRYPDMVARAAPIAGTARNTDHDWLYTATLNDAITSDPAWNGGWYAQSSDVHIGLRRHARLWAVMGFSTEFYQQGVWRGFGFTSIEDFTIGFLEAYFLPMDANDLLCMGWKWQHGDASRHTGGDLAAALRRIKAKTFVMPIDEDMFFPPRDCEAECRLTPNAELRLLKTPCGHLVLNGLDPAWLTQVDQHLGELLATPA